MTTTTTKRNNNNNNTDFGNGIHIQWLPVNQAWALMWHESVLYIYFEKYEAQTAAKELAEAQ